MDLWQLKVFVSVVENQSFSRAGEAIHLSQPTVSSHIKELEEHFGCRLIDRLGRKALPTKAGRTLLLYAKKLLNLSEETESAMSELLGGIKGHLILGGSTIPAGYIIPKLIGPFTSKYPDITLSLIAGDTQRIVEHILAGEAETGIVGARINEPNLHQEKLVDDEMKLIVQTSHPLAKKKSVSINRLFKEPFLAREQGSGTWKSITTSITEAGFNPQKLNIIATLGNTASVIQAILNHAGISILSTISVEDQLETGQLVAMPVHGLDLKRSFYLTWQKRRALSPISETFLQFVRDTI